MFQSEVVDEKRTHILFEMLFFNINLTIFEIINLTIRNTFTGNASHI